MIESKNDGKQPGLWLLLKVWCDNEYLETRPQYAVVEVDEAFVDRMLAGIRWVVDTKRTVDDKLHTMEFWDYSPYWIADLSAWTEGDGAKVKDLLTGTDAMSAVEDGPGLALLAEKPTYDEDDANNRTECVTRHVTDDGVRWQAVPKHTSDYVDAATVHVDDWKRIKKVLQSRAKVGADGMVIGADDKE
jgi:hypothetical protein